MGFTTPLTGSAQHKSNRAPVSAARCARVSYLNFSGDSDPEKDIRLADRLLKAEHMSPFEHQVKPRSGQYGIYDGWQSYRWELEND